MLSSCACYSLAQWKGIVFQHCKVRDRTQGGEANHTNSSHPISQTGQCAEKKKVLQKRIQGSRTVSRRQGWVWFYQAFPSSAVPRLPCSPLFQAACWQKATPCGREYAATGDQDPITQSIPQSLTYPALTLTHRKIWKLSHSITEVFCLSQNPAFSPEESRMQ